MSAPATLPPHVAVAHDGWTVSHAWAGEWTNTWRLQKSAGDIRFVKVGWANHYPTLAQERDRMVWCAPYITVPHVIDYDTDGDLDWLITSPLRGVDATIEKLTMPHEEIVPLLARGLRTWHETLPVTDCPFDLWTFDGAIEHCERRVRDETTTWEGFRGRNESFTPAEALAELRRLRPDSEDPVVCHGDYCFPNVFIEDGEITGFLDLGELVVADPWRDLAVGAWSVTWNVDPALEPLFYEAYGVEPDEQRIAFFRLLYELSA